MKPINFQNAYLVLELTNKCNLNCDHCVRNQDAFHLKKQGFMNFDMIKNIIEDIKENNMKFWDLNLFWLGEPLLHPDFERIYTYILEKNSNMFQNINVHTNANYLSEKIVNLLLRYPNITQTWHLTLDAFNEETYFKLKKRNNFKQTVENCKNLIRKKKGIFPRIVMQFIVEEANYKEVDSFVNFWSKQFKEAELPFDVVTGFVPAFFSNYIFLRELDPTYGIGQGRQKLSKMLYHNVQKKYPPPSESNQKIIYDKTVFFDKFPFKTHLPKSNVCSCPWKSPVISWNGDVTLCTSDSEMELTVGNVNKEPFSKIWWENENLSNYRNIMISNREKLKMKCKTCLIPQSSNYVNMSNDEILYYLKRKHREDLFFNTKFHKEKILIDPFVFSDSKGDIGFYQGEDGFKEGFSFVFIKGKGFLEYEFKTKKKVKNIEINMASLNWKNNLKTKVEIVLNGKTIASELVEPMGKGNGRIYSFPVNIPFKEENVLRINAKELAIFYQPLKKGLIDTPIKIDLS